MQKRIQRGVLLVLEVTSEDPGQDTDIFVCQDKPIAGTVPAPPVVDPKDMDYILYPSRVLQTIASRRDLDDLPSAPAAPGDLYRVGTVAALFDFENQTNTFLKLVIEDVKRNAYLQGLPHMVDETLVSSDPLENNAPITYAFR